MAIHRPQGNTQTDESPGRSVRQVMLEVIEEYSKIGSGYFQTVPILREVAKRCGTSSLAQEQVVLTVWGDLFRSGLLGEGHDLSNPSLPFCHLTSRGREALRNISRDPANPDGYIAYVASRANLDDVSRSYLFEAVHTFNSASFKSAAVMIGAAAESLILRLRDKLANQLATTDLPLPAGLSDWRIKTARDALTVFFDGKKKTMPRKLREAYEAYWLAFAEQIRRVRNDAGHPQSVDPVSEEAVHASLLIFPELAHLVCDLEAWIEG